MEKAAMAAIFREIIKISVRKMGLLQREGNSCGGITLAQCHTLIEIAKYDGVSLNDLAAALTLDKSTMSRTVNKLVNAGLVEREIDKADRRYMKISLTPSGQELTEQINFDMQRYYETVLAAVPKDLQTQLGQLLPYLLAAVKNTGSNGVQCQKILSIPMRRGGGNNGKS